MPTHPRSARRSRRAAALALVVALGVLGACSNSSSDNGGGAKGSDSNGSDNGALYPESAMNQPQQEGKPAEGGSVKFAVESNVSTLVPGDMAQPSDVTIGLAVYDPLLGFDDKGDTVADSLATKIEHSDDLKTWTLQLRDGVKFSDGEAFDAAAVVTQMNALKGRPSCLCKTDVDNMASVEATGPLTVKFTLAKANVAFPIVIAGSTGWIASPKAWAAGADGLNKNPVGTGPFVLSDYNTLTFKKNPNYWRTDAEGRHLPYLDEIRFQPYPDTKTRLQALKSGDVDIMQTADTDNLVEAKGEKGIVTQPVTGASSTILVLNTHKPPFDDIRMRQAFNYALDRNAVNQTGYKGARVPAYGALPVDSPYYDADAQLPDTDAAKAKQLVDELKKEGKSVSYEAICISTPEASRIFQIISPLGKAAGMNPKQVQMDQGAYVSKMFSKQGDFQEACFRSAMAPDPDTLYDGLHTGGGTNIALYSNPKVDAALEAGRETTDFDERKKQYDIVQQELAKDVVIVPLLFDLYGNIHRSDVSGLSRPRPTSLGLIEVGYLYKVAP